MKPTEEIIRYTQYEGHVNIQVDGTDWNAKYQAFFSNLVILIILLLGAVTITAVVWKELIL